MTLSIRQRIAIRLHVFKENCAGVAAVEFAYLLPLLIMMTYGVIEASRAVMMHKRFQRSVAMVGDLVVARRSNRRYGRGRDRRNGRHYEGCRARHERRTHTASLKMGITAIQADMPTTRQLNARCLVLSL